MECSLLCFFLLFFSRLLHPALAQSSNMTEESATTIGEATAVPSTGQTISPTMVPNISQASAPTAGSSSVSCSSCLVVEMTSMTVSMAMAVSPTPDPSSGLTTDQIIGIAVGVGAAVILVTLMAIIITFLVIKSNTHESRVVPLNKKRGSKSPELLTVTHGKTVQMNSLPPAE